METKSNYEQPLAAKTDKPKRGASEQGHIVNQASFHDMALVCETFGSAYNPPREVLKVQSLKTLANEALRLQNEVNKAELVYRKALHERDKVALILEDLLPRAFSALKASESDTRTDEDAQALIRKLRGQRVGAKLNDEQLKAAAEDGKPVTQRSVSQTGINNRLNVISSFFSLLASTPQYQPNEPALKPQALIELHEQLSEKRTAVSTADSLLNNARDARNKLFYAGNVGLIDLSLDVKNYVKSVFGNRSAQYKKLAALKFKKYYY